MAPIPQSSHAMLHVSVKDESITETPDFVAQSTAMGSQSVKQTISHLPRHEMVKLIPGNETDPMTAPVVHSVEVKMNSFVTSYLMINLLMAHYYYRLLTPPWTCVSKHGQSLSSYQVT